MSIQQNIIKTSPKEDYERNERWYQASKTMSYSQIAYSQELNPKKVSVSRIGYVIARHKKRHKQFHKGGEKRG